MVNVFVYGMSGAGKDTVSDYLRDNHDFVKLRIAGTIKQYVYETYGFKSIEEFEIAKRNIPDVRIAHNIIGNQYDKESLNRSNNEASLNRLNNIINSTLLEFEIIKDLKKKNRCVCDVRCESEVKLLIEAGWIGIFLARTSIEYRDENHKTEQSIFLNDILRELSHNEKFSNQIFIIDNFDRLEPQEPQYDAEGHYIITNGSKEHLQSVIEHIISNISNK